MNLFFREDIEQRLRSLASASQREPNADVRAGYLMALRDVALAHGIGISALATLAAPEPTRGLVVMPSARNE